jgi:LacI family transcriptional regulator
MAKITDVAKLAGVSTATVSRVLNMQNTVDPELALRVRKAAADLGYRLNGVARSLRRNESSLWAVIIPDITSPIYTTMVRGIEDVAQAAGYSIVLCNSDDDGSKQAAYISVSLSLRMAGVIICPASESSTDVSPLLEGRTPVVILDRKIDDARIDSVLVDNEKGAEDATRHLIASGYRRIACVTGPRIASTASERVRGYENAHRAARRRIDPDLIYHTQFREAAGYRAIGELLALPDPPDAVFVASNLLTLGVLRYLAQHRVPIPQGLGVVGFDDLPWQDLVAPGLTTVEQPAYDVGRVAAQSLIQRMTDTESAPSTVTLPAQLIVRESSRGPAGTTVSAELGL